LPGSCDELMTADNDHLMSFLAGAASNVPASVVPGPVCFEIDNLADFADRVPETAGLYCAGFRDSIKTYPYLRVRGER